MRNIPRRLLNALAAFALAAGILMSERAPASAAAEDDAADLGVTNLSESDTAAPGSDVTFVVKVVNAGPASAPARLDDALPPGITFVSLSAPPGWTCATPAEGAGGDVACNSSGVAVSDGEDGGDQFTLVVRVSKGAASRSYLSNRATVSTSAFDPDDENNSATASVRVTN